MRVDDHDLAAGVAPTVSLVVPAHNAADRIFRVLDLASRNCRGPFEMVVIADSCADRTAQEVDRFRMHLLHEDWPVTRFVFVESRRPLFETACDDVGFRVASAPYIIEIQSDMLIEEPDFDRSLIAHLVAWNDVIAVSGRCCHPLEWLRPVLAERYGSDIAVGASLQELLAGAMRRQAGALRTRISSSTFPAANPAAISAPSPPGANTCEIAPPPTVFATTGVAGRPGPEVAERLPDDLADRSRLWLGQTVNRGPLALRRDYLLSLGGLNRDAFFQGFDEHDLMLRAYLERGWRCGFCPVDFHSPLHLGTTRRRRPVRQDVAIVAAAVRRRRNWLRSALLQWANGSLYIGPSSLEVRRLGGLS